MHELAAGAVFAGFRIERVLGSGGMGSVYAARHPRLPRLVALKLLHSSYSADPVFRGRFEREAELAGRLDHPNIVAIHDRGSEDGRLWIAMQYVAGSDAEAAVREGRVPSERALHIARSTADALDYAHAAGLLHRDVKPANILLRDGAPGVSVQQVLLTDFGIAKAIDEGTALTQTGSLVATLRYAAPEQLDGRQAGPRSDQYALACTLFHLLAGRPPYTATTAGALVGAHLMQPIPRISELVPGLSVAVDTAFERALAKNPDHRYANCAGMVTAIAHAVTTGAAPTQPITDPHAPLGHGTAPPHTDPPAGIHARATTDHQSGNRTHPSTENPAFRYPDPQSGGRAQLSTGQPFADPAQPYTEPGGPAQAYTDPALGGPDSRSYGRVPPYTDPAAGHSINDAAGARAWTSPDSARAGNPSSDSHALEIGGRSAHGGARRGRTAWIAAAVVGVAAVLAVVATVVLNRNEPGTGHAPGTTTIAPTTTADAWAAARPTIAMFPDLLPAGPDSAGHRGLRCSFATKNPDAMWDTGFNCTDRDNLELQVLSHPDTETVGQFVATMPVGTSQQVRSRYGRPLTVRSFNGSTGPWLLVQFDAAPHSTVLLQVFWKGHTHQEMIDEWLTSAPL
ncbi:serine/threonine-protein kinase [Nocardia mangyaensis]|uniref:serine/threonine-protein kinase n=1 Tax=Nocardia mangyaensis TaxID=2213200 RepID=UPI002675EF13|nr:serine/threonine-protein kinase [Nocardia mangyaensis]MDO3646493.1 serine/threonine-protein kinase [Nocardia mangyaensis]